MNGGTHHSFNPPSTNFHHHPILHTPVKFRSQIAHTLFARAFAISHACSRLLVLWKGPYPDTYTGPCARKTLL